MAAQIFHRGDRVRVAAQFPESMSHFDGRGEEAIVMGSYHDQYGGRADGGANGHTYTLLFLSGAEISWYDEALLTAIDGADGTDEIARIQREREEKNRVESDLAWIVEHWPEIRERPSGATMESLMRQIGITNPWGSQGEGYVWYQNAIMTRALFEGIIATKPTVEQARAALEVLRVTRTAK